MTKFTVIDKKTGAYPDLFRIALNEAWAKPLMACDMEGFALLEDGALILLDECGEFVYCPSDRFEVVPLLPIKDVCEGIHRELKMAEKEIIKELTEHIKGVVEFDISLSEAETEYLLLRIDEVLKEYLEGNT